MDEPRDAASGAGAPGGDGAYAGVRVLDVSQGIAGPYCAALLAAHGADVVKVEPPAGDWLRSLGARHGEHSSLAIWANIGKRGITLDLKSAAGLEAALALAARADVVVEGFRPGVADRLGIGFEAVRAVRPGVIYLSVSGYGQAGPYRDRACSDTVAQAFSGIMATNVGADDAPHRVGFTVVDVMTALFGFQAIAPALHARAGPCHLDVSLMQAAAAVQGYRIVDASLGANAPAALNVPAGTYRTGDGWIAVTLVTEAHFAALCDALGLPALASDPDYRDFDARAAHRAALEALVARHLAEHTTAAWCERLAAAGVLHERVRDHRDWLADPHVRAVDAAPERDQPGVGTIRVPRVPGSARDSAPLSPAPAPGEHTREVLRECGYDEARIAAMIETGAAGSGPQSPDAV